MNRPASAEILECDAGGDPVNGYDPARTYEGSEEKLFEFNKTLAKIVDAKRAAGAKVEFVDLHSLLSRKDLGDGIHPNCKGYKRIAQAWFEVITSGTDNQ